MLYEISQGLVGGLLTGVSGLALAATFTPKLQAKILPHPRESNLSDLLQFCRVEEDGETLLTKDGRRVMVIQLRGVDESAKTADEIQSLLRQKQVWLDRLFENGIAFKMITTRRKIPHTMEGAYDHSLLQEIHDQWMQDFDETYKMEHFLVFSSPKLKRNRYLKAKRPTRGSALKDIVTMTLEDLSAYKPVILDNQGDRSPLLSFWASLLARETIEIPPTSENLSEKLVSAPVSFDTDEGFIVYEGLLSKTYEAVLNIKVWGEETRASILREILSVPAEITLLHQIKGLTKFEAHKKLGIKKAQQQSQLGKEEIYTAQELLNGEECTLGTYQFSLFVQGKSPEHVKESLSRIQVILRDYGMVGSRERDAIEWVWRCQFPGFDYLLRPVQLLSHNLSHFMNLDYTPTGLHRCDWGEGPIRSFKTAMGASYGLQFHVSEEKEAVGHSVMIAPTGSGKTTLVQHLIAGALRHKDFKAFIFDRLQGTQIFTQSLGGTAIDLSSGEIPLNPFLVEDTSYNRLFLQKFLLKLAKQEHSPKALTEISRALDLIFQVPPENRILTALFDALFAQTSPLKESLRPWVQGGAYAQWFNGAREGKAYDVLSFEASRLVSFEMEHIQEDAHLASVMTDYIFYKIRSSMMDRSYPHFVFVDEAKAQLADSDFKEDLKAALNQQRKLRGAVCLAFQSPEQITDVGLEGSITTQCPTVFLFPNPSARPASYKMFNLTEAEWDYIVGKNKVARRLKHSVLVKRQDESVILDIDLRGLGPLIRLYKSGNEAVQLVKRLQHQFGGEQWVSTYLQAA